MKEISIRELFKIYQSEYIYKIIDCRNTNDFDKYHIKDTFNIPFDILCEKPYLFLNKDYEYFVLSKNGKDSKAICMFLNKYGYNLINIVEGIDAWPGYFIQNNRFHVS